MSVIKKILNFMSKCYPRQLDHLPGEKLYSPIFDKNNNNNNNNQEKPRIIFHSHLPSLDEKEKSPRGIHIKISQLCEGMVCDLILKILSKHRSPVTLLS